MKDESQNPALVVERLVRQTQPLLTIDNNSDIPPLAVVPPGCVIESLEHFLPRPLRIKAAPAFEDIRGFCVYINEFKGAATRMWVKAVPGGAIFLAIIDHHTKEEEGDKLVAGWCNHSARFNLKYSPEWNLWKGMSGKWVGQLEMAEFIQDNIRDVANPPGAEMLELTQTLRVTTNVEFDAQHLLKNGQVKLNYAENVVAKAGVGEMVMPETFDLGIPVFEHQSRFKITCKLRFRVESKKLTMRIDIPGLHAILKEVLEAVVEDVEDNTGLHPMWGSHE